MLDFPDLDEPAEPRGHRLLARASRLPDPVRDDIVRHFGSLTRLLSASVERLIEVEGVGETRADQLRAFFDRLQAVALDEPILEIRGRVLIEIGEAPLPEGDTQLRFTLDASGTVKPPQ